MTIPVHYEPVHHGFWTFAVKDLPLSGVALGCALACQ
jgi:hypothetical protein